MLAVTIPRFGDKSVLTVAEVEDPLPAPGEVSIDVAYAGVNYAEVLYRRGVVPVPLPFVPGIEVSGHVKALGQGVRGFHVGEPVAALTIVASGGYAETVVTDARLVVGLNTVRANGKGIDLAANLPLAAAVPSNTTTAFLVLETVAHLQAGERVLVHAAAGGVGGQLGQVAKLLGAGAVVGVVGSPAKIAAAAALGYDRVLIRGEPLVDADGRFDVVVDMVGGPARQLSLNALHPLGRLVVMGNASDAPDHPLSSNALWFGSLTAAGFNLAQIAAAQPERVGAALKRGLVAIAAGDIRVDLTGELQMTEAPQAHEVVESGNGTGKLVLRIGGS